MTRNPPILTLVAFLVAILSLGVSRMSAAIAGHSKPAPHRLIVLTDIGADPDDSESMVRLLLYSDEIDIQGLIATTSTWKRSSVSPEMIRPIIDAYGKVRGNLVLHDPNYPEAAALQAVVKQGLPVYGMQGVGPGRDSEGSNWIIHCLEQKDDRPLWVSIWGGANTLAQALFTLRATKSPKELHRLVSKLRVYSISDQDDSGPWIRKAFPDLFMIVSPGGDYGSATWIGINSVIPGIDNTTISNRWIAANIQQGHGPLGAVYPDVAYGMEGDTPSWLGLIPNGLNAPEHPDWGGWGGRYQLVRPDVPVADPKTFIGGVPIPQETRPIWTNAVDTYTPPVHGEYGRAIKPGDASFTGAAVSLWRWRDDFQDDFAARMEWATRPFKDANHPPVVELACPAEFTVKSGQGFGLGVRATDPDGDSLSYYWFPYPEAGTYRGPIAIDSAEDLPGVWVIAPKVTAPATIHFIVRVTDKGTPPLTRYRRVIVTVEP